MDLDDCEELLADKPRDEKWELIGGRVAKMMTGARWGHHFIVQHINFALSRHLRESGSPCRVSTESFRSKEDARDPSLLPDGVVRCGPMTPGATSLSDPAVLVEVVSDGSVGRDRAEKWRVYQKLPSLEPDVLVECDKPVIEVVDRAGRGLVHPASHRGPRCHAGHVCPRYLHPPCRGLPGRAQARGMNSAPRAFVIGHPISHSRSPLIHRHWLERHGLAGSYEKIAVAPEALEGFIRGLRDAGFVGGNVTVPHKARALGLADAVDEAADAIGAANTLWFDGDDLVAGNTDAEGFLLSLDDEAPGWDGRGASAVVLGAGGAARAVVHGLLERGFEVAVANRTFVRAADLAEEHDDGVFPYAWDEVSGLLGTADLVVNTTVLGMAGQPPLLLDLGDLRRDTVVADIVYTPLETPLVAAARARGSRAVGGLGMLLHQAVPGFERWFGVRPEVTPELRALVEADVRGGA